ncbi:hypothetical protein, partial [Agrococcus citreus]|uniref:hypothetical protein n=1 Tax=Agrococcus citreus TaxID=84643 RepID=UPI0031D2D53A
MTAAVIAVMAIAVGAWLLARLPSTQLAASATDASTAAPEATLGPTASASAPAADPAPTTGTVPTGVGV